jgi:transcriptional regulator with XRE-family HTH domain
MLTGKGLKKLRKYKDYHQKEIAHNMNVCQQYISKLESRKRVLNLPDLERILKAMHINGQEWEQRKHLF